MATFNELSEDEQRIVQNNDTLMRAAILKDRAAIVAMKTFVQDYDAVASSIYAKLADGEAVKRTTTLDGAIDVPHEVTVAMVEAFRTLIAVWDNEQTTLKHAQLVGAVNLQGR